MPEQRESPIYSPERERSREQREVKEHEIDPELAAAATRERADYLVKEVKSSKQQMQNILVHMAQVQSAIAQIRAQLALVAQGDDTSLAQDSDRVDALRKKIAAHTEELEHMRGDLVKIAEQELHAAGVAGSPDELRTQAEAHVSALLAIARDHE